MKRAEALTQAALALRTLLMRSEEAGNQRDAYVVESMGGPETVREIIDDVEATARQYQRRRR